MVETVFSANNREQVMVLPWTPPGLQIAERQNNNTFDGLSRGRAMIGTMAPRVISFSSIFPKVHQRWMHPQALHTPLDYVEFFRKWREELVPIRIVITDNTREIINMAVTVDDFTWKLRKNGDYEYSITLSEYVFIK